LGILIIISAYFFLSTPGWANDVVILSQKVGSEINKEENVFYNIFPDVKGFVNAQLIQQSNNRYIFRIVTKRNGEFDEIIKHMNLKEFATLQNYVNGQPEMTEEAKIAMFEGLDYLKAGKIVNEIPKPQFVKIKYSKSKTIHADLAGKLNSMPKWLRGGTSFTAKSAERFVKWLTTPTTKGTLIKVEENILHIQTATRMDQISLSDVDAISYRLTIGEYDFIKPYLYGISAFVGMGMAQIYNSQREDIYNEYDIPRKDLNRYTQLSGFVIGLIFSSELFDAISTLLTPSETFILSKDTYERQKQK
jgi:hypothetical protein